jgi:hypothetical protein
MTGVAVVDGRKHRGTAHVKPFDEAKAIGAVDDAISQSIVSRAKLQAEMDAAEWFHPFREQYEAV